MKRAWTYSTALFTLFALLSATAVGRQPPPAGTADPVRVVLDKKGYVSVPLSQVDEGNGFTAACKSGTESWRMLLDTGAQNSALDLGLVKKLGLKQQGETTVTGIEGNQKSFDVTLRGLSIGKFDTRAMATTLPFNAYDLTAKPTNSDERKFRRVGGLLGHSTLWHTSAVIDYSARTLYLRTPLEGLLPMIEGKWVAVSGQEDGQERKLDPNTPPTLEFKDRRFCLTDGAKRSMFGLHVNTQPGADQYAVLFFDPKLEFAEELRYLAGGLLKVAGDKLTVCLVLDPAKAKGMPNEFKAPAGSGAGLLLEFRRDKPRPAQTAGGDPLRAVLEKKGYVAVPLGQDEGGYFTVKCKSGTERLRLILDTGAGETALDTVIVKKLGLKPKREFTVGGTGGTVKGAEVSLRGLSIGNFDTRSTVNALSAAAYAFSTANAALANQKLQPIDGLLGHDTLATCEAVIDYSTRTLYLRKPLDGLWPEIEGKWVAVSGQDDGEDKKIDPKTPPRLEFRDRLFGLTYGGNFYRFGMHVMPGKDHYTIALFNPWQELDGELDYRAGGLMKVGGDKLTLCLLLNPTKTKGKMPEEFKSAAGSGHILFEFRREK